MASSLALAVDDYFNMLDTAKLWGYLFIAGVGIGFIGVVGHIKTGTNTWKI